MDLARLRFGWLVKALLLCFVGVEARLVYLQVRSHPEKAAEAERMYRREEKLLAERGAIKMRNDYPLAESVPAVRIWADSNWTARKDDRIVPEQRERIAAEIEDALARPIDGLRAELEKPGYRLIALEPLENSAAARRTLADGEQIVRLLEKKRAGKLPGITIERTFLRSYPQKELAANVAGFVDASGVGQAGIEHSYDAALTGVDGDRTLKRDNQGQTFFDVGCGVTAPQAGHDVHLTLDAVIQYYLEEELDGVVSRHRPRWTAGVVLDPRTGEVLAMASRPSYDPNRYATFEMESQLNRCVTLAYTPGSTFKPFMMAAVIEATRLSLNHRIDCSSLKVGGREIHDSHRNGKLTPAEIMAESSNIGMAKLVLRLVPESLGDGADRLAGFERVRGKLTELGFGRELEVGLPAESAGQLSPARMWTRHYTLASLAFGHEIAVTPLQLAAAFATFANGGVYCEPWLVEKVVAEDGEVVERNAPRARRVFARGVAEKVRDMLVSAVDEGTGTKAAIDGYTVAGKTSTAQWERDPTKYTSSFAGFAPARDPQLLVTIVVDQPRKGGHYGGTVAAPAAREVLARGLAYLRVPCDRTPGG